MNLTFKERLVFNALYPQKGNLSEQILVQDISKKVQFTQEEMQNANYKVEGRLASWDETKVKETEISFTGAELNFLKTRVDELDKNKEITQDILSLCQKIKEEK